MKTFTTTIRLALVGLFLATLYGCDSQGDETNPGSAQIIGSIASQTTIAMRILQKHARTICSFGRRLTTS